jgi:dUTPase
MDIKFYFDNEEDYYDLVPQTEGSSGIDLRSNQDMILKSKDFRFVDSREGFTSQRGEGGFGSTGK